MVGTAPPKDGGGESNAVVMRLVSSMSVLPALTWNKVRNLSINIFAPGETMTSRNLSQATRLSGSRPVRRAYRKTESSI